MVRFAIYADDIAIWCVGRTSRGSAARASLQRAIKWTVRDVNTMDLEVSPSKTASICYSPRSRLPTSTNKLFLSGQPIHRVRIHSYLGLLVNDRMNWRPATSSVLAFCQRFLRVLRRLCIPTRGNSQHSPAYLPQFVHISHHVCAPSLW